MKSKGASFESLRKQLHQTLRNWHRTQGEIAPIFSSLYLFGRVEIPGQLSRWQRRSQGYRLGRIYLKTNKRHKAAGVLKSAAKLWEETGKPVIALKADDLLQIVEPNRSLHN